MWIIVAIVGYLLIACAVVLDKFLLQSRIPKPTVYAFYLSLFSLVAFILFPFGFELPELKTFLIALVGGILFTYALLVYYYAIRESEAVKVASLTGSASTLVIALFSIIFVTMHISVANLLALLSLLIGGFIISFNLGKSMKLHHILFFSGFKKTLFASLILAISLILIKYIYTQNNFVTGYIVTRLGLFIGGISLLLYSKTRKEILDSFKKDKSNKKKTKGGVTGGLFILTKALGGIGTLLVNYSIFLGSVSFVQALTGMQYFFVFLLTYLFSFKFSQIFQVDLSLGSLIQKVTGIILIALGLAFLAFGGEAMLY